MGSSEQIIQEIKDRAGIVNVVSRYVDLKRKSGRYWGRCPFHAEKTASFSVNEENQFYYCFGCHAKGDVFSFLQNIEGIGFGEALERLAAETGVELPKKTDFKQDQEKQSLRQRILEINGLAQDWFKRSLTPDSPAKKYLKKRGVSPEMVERFLLGFAPPGWENLQKELARHSVASVEVERAGLAKVGQKGNRIDRFRNRLMFPIAMEQQRIVGFGGRAIDPEDKGPKYLNSPESVAFDKSNCLYGFFQALQGIRRKKRCLVVEGNLDVVMMHQGGLDETVATLGTAMTEKHVRRLKRLAPDLVLIYDGDAAGRKAAFKSLSLFLEQDVSARVVLLPPEHDPDSFIRQYGAEEMEALVAAAPYLLDVWLDDLLSHRAPGHPGVADCVEAAVPMIGKLRNRVLKERYLDDLSTRLQLDRNLLRAEIRQHAAKKGKDSKQFKFSNLSLSEVSGPDLKAHEDLLLMLYRIPETVAEWFEEDEVVERLPLDPFPEVVQTLLDARKEEKNLSVVELIGCFDGSDLQERMVERLTGTSERTTVYTDIFVPETARTIYLDCLNQLNLQGIRNELADLNLEIDEARKSGDHERFEQLLLKKWELNRELSLNTEKNLRLIENGED